MASHTVINSVAEDGGELPAYRTLPHNLEAEQALLGAVLINNEALNQVAAFLEPGHFYLPVHGRVFEAVLKMVERGQIASPVTLKHYFDHDDSLSEVGGAQYLARLAGSAVTIINAEHYGRAIYDLAMRRELISIGEEMVNEAYDASLDESAVEQIENSEQKLFNLAEEGGAEGGFRAFHAPLREAVDMITQACKRDGNLSGSTTGFIDMDKLLGGLHASDLIILAGRPGMGKTALATNIAFNAAQALKQEKDEHGNIVAEHGAKVGFFSLEMSAEQLATRILAERSEISSEKLRKGELTDNEFSKVVRASQEIESLPIYIDDTPALSVAGLRARARRLKRQHGLSLVIVDYLQLMRPSSSMRLNNRVQEVSEITQGLKALAKELDLPVLALSQLSRAVEQRDDKRPQLSDLRESGSIEQDADVVMFVYREQYYLARKQPEDGTVEHAEWMERMERVHNLAEVIVAKQRHGPIGKIDMFFNEYLTRFGDYDRVHNQMADDAPF
ncbi:MAG: replicative DNA helicase [Rhodospirillaceae bacterium]|nr:replicative DNA helicase [Rhodospirillaceae bacterium]